MRPHPSPAAIPVQLTVIAYPDPLVDDLGYGPESAYLECFCWLPIIGPSAAWMWRRLARIAIETGPAPTAVDAIDLLVGLGLGEGLGRTSIGARTIGRLVTFDFARRAGRSGELLAVRGAVGRLPEHRARRLLLTARQYHETSPR